MKKNILFLITVVLLAFSSCKDDEPVLGEAPTSADAEFTFVESVVTSNIIDFKAVRSDVVAVWDFGNGTSAEGVEGTGTYPRRGTYTVTLTIFSQGGSASTSQDLVIINDDFSLLSDPLFTYLTGGVDSLNGKTWAIDSASIGHFGVGPNPIDPAFGDTSNYYSAGINEKVGASFYDDRYVFKIGAFSFDMITQGIIYLNGNQSAAFPGSYDPGVGDLSAPFPDQLGESWLLKFDAGEDTTLTVSGNSFLGYNTGVNTYKVIRLTENSMYLSYEDQNDAALRWYIRLIPRGSTPTSGGGGGGGGSTGFPLPMDFETVEPTFAGFNGSSVAVINNPVAFGNNTSSKVLETVHGSSADAGITVDLDAKLDFSTNGKIKFKLFAPSGGVFKFKIEDQSDAQNNVEVDITCTATPGWISYEADFTGSSSGVYDKLVLFPGWNTTSTDTYYIDDISR